MLPTPLLTPNQLLFALFGGTLLLLYGIRMVGEGLQKAAGGRMRTWLTALTAHRIRGFLAGVVVTVLMQSSGATTVLLVGLVSAGLLELEQSLAVVLGANVGTTVVVQLLAFPVLNYGLLITGAGLALALWGRRPLHRYLGQALAGIGFLFLGMGVLTQASLPLRESELVRQIFQELARAPFLVFLLSVGITAVVHSSAAVLGVGVALAQAGILPIETALPLVLGANVGTAVAALVSAIGSPLEARQVALANLFFKGLGALLSFPFLPWLPPFLARLSAQPGRQVAHAHTLFNLALALVGLPLTGAMAGLLRRLLPEQRETTSLATPRYLDEQALDSPALALGQAIREALRMADIVQGMLRDVFVALERDDEVLLHDVIHRDDVVDALDEAIKRYLSHLGEQGLSEEQSRRQIGVLYVVNDIENIGDIIVKNLVELALKKVEGQHIFSEEGWRELKAFHDQVQENLSAALAAFAAQDIPLAEEVIRRKAAVNRQERELRRAHIARLNQGLPESIDTSAIHLDILSNLKHINSLATNIAYVVAGHL